VQTATRNRGTALPSRFLDLARNPFYYKPISICVNDEKATYTIIPRREPLFAQWIGRPLPRDEAYFNQNSLAARFLIHHRIFRDKRDGDQRVTFPANGDNASQYLSFMQSFEPSGKALQSLTIALAPYDAGFEPELLSYERTDGGMIPFRYVRTASPSPCEVKSKIEAILTAARDQGVDILIFPELVVDHDARTEIGQFLCHHNSSGQLKLVVAGSFHSERGQGGYVNQAPMFDWQGNVVWRHDKLSRYALHHREMGKSAKGISLRKRLKVKAGNRIEENIHIAHPLAFVDTPIGRMATLICLDYLQAPVIQTVLEIGCDFLLVPLMTTSIDMFRRHAMDEYGAKLHALSACSASISCCEMFEAEAKDLSFLYVPTPSFAKSEPYSGLTVDKEHRLFIYRLDKKHL
jgi:predicted amidohydrolase